METILGPDSLLQDLAAINRLTSKIQVPKIWQGELLVLNYLQRHTGQTVFPVQIKDALELTSARVSIILNGLEKKGYISRRMAEGDRRKVWVAITCEGESYRSGQLAEVRRLLQPLFDELGEDDTQELARIVHRLADIVGQTAQH